MTLPTSFRSGTTILITGGAGFIGSHIADKLVSTGVEEIRILDNLSTGNISNLSNCINNTNNNRFKFIKGDLGNSENIEKALKDVNVVFHMAAYPEVRTGFDNPDISYNENVRNTFYLLEKIRKSTKIETIIFSSSSTVYGEPEVIPTPENYGLILPISPYGASKLACEALISSYCHTYSMKGMIFRLANVVGARSTHGVISDFIKKLRINNKQLEILGDGHQSKSYIHVSDCVECFLFCLHSEFNNTNKKVEIFNVGNDDKMNVISIARAVCNAMGLQDVELLTTGGLRDGRGWIGDVKNMQLDISKLKALGWSPTLSSLESIRLASKEILKDIVAP
jgi:UDP-glucose 4-epimerase